METEQTLQNQYLIVGTCQWAQQWVPHMCHILTYIYTHTQGSNKSASILYVSKIYVKTLNVYELGGPIEGSFSLWEITKTLVDFFFYQFTMIEIGFMLNCTKSSDIFTYIQNLKISTFLLYIVDKLFKSNTLIMHETACIINMQEQTWCRISSQLIRLITYLVCILFRDIINSRIIN